MFHLGRNDRTKLEFELFDEEVQTVSEHRLVVLWDCLNLWYLNKTHFGQLMLEIVKLTQKTFLSTNFCLRELHNFTQFHIKSMLVCTKASNPNHRRNNLQNVISSFCCEEDENFILGNYAAYSGNSLSMVGTTLQSQ